MSEFFDVMNNPARLISLETFRLKLEEIFGEEPGIWMLPGEPIHSPEDIVDVRLTDYLGWHLKARHGALYRWEGEGFDRAAAFGLFQQTGSMPLSFGADAALPRWLLDNGLLIRSRLTLGGLTAEEGERLFAELDRLGAHLVAPVAMNGGLWGFLAMGPSLDGGYGADAALRLGLYGANMLGALSRKEKGLPGSREARHLRDTQAQQELVEIWRSVRTPGWRDLILILDEDPGALEWTAEYFRMCGFEVWGTTSEEEAVRELSLRKPSILVVDFSPHWRVPEALLRAAGRIVPEAVIFGSSTSRDERVDRRVLRMGVSQIFRRPSVIARLATAALEAAIRNSVKEGLPAPQRKKRCLVVDDEREAVALIGSYLETKGFEVQPAGTAEEALLQAEKAQPDLILLDLRLPGMDGAELFERLREIAPLAKVIVITAWFHEYPEHKLKALQPDAYALKPVPLEELDRLVEQVQMEPAVG